MKALRPPTTTASAERWRETGRRHPSPTRRPVTSYLGGVGHLYWYFTTPNMEYFIPTLDLPSAIYLQVLGVFFYLLVKLRILQVSLDRRCLHLPSTWRNNAFVSPLPSAENALGSFTRLRSATCTMNEWRKRAFTIQSQEFDVSFAVRAAAEIVLQSYQAYLLSVSVSRTWIVDCAVATIVLNCLSTPLIYGLTRLLHLSQAHCRLLCVMRDAVLDFTNACLAPMMVFIPYLRVFD